MASSLYDIRHHAWAVAPIVAGLALQIVGVPGAFVVGLLGTVIGVAVSCAVMAYEMGGMPAAIVRFPAVLLFIACGGVVGGHIGSTMKERHVNEAERQSQDHGATHRS